MSDLVGLRSSLPCNKSDCLIDRDAQLAKIIITHFSRGRKNASPPLLMVASSMPSAESHAFRHVAGRTDYLLIEIESRTVANQAANVVLAVLE